MTCEEFRRVLPELGGGYRIEQHEHLKSCCACSDLLADLNAISREARLLQSSEDPSPWVWNSIEIALRQEGLIRRPQLEHSGSPTMLSSRLRWLVPLAAMFLIIFGILIYQRGTGQPQLAEQPLPVAGVVTANLQATPTEVMGGEDLQLLKTVSERTPAMRDTYEADLRSVNAYIRDAEQSVKSNPNDEVAQQYLRGAYEQKAMVYEMALDRSLP